MRQWFRLGVTARIEVGFNKKLIKIRRVSKCELERMEGSGRRIWRLFENAF